MVANFMFMNEKPLFKDIQHTRRFEVHVLSTPRYSVKFDLVAIDSSLHNRYDCTLMRGKGLLWALRMITMTGTDKDIVDGL